MPTPTYTPLANFTVGSNSPTAVTFSNIPSTYRDLVIIGQLSVAGGNTPRLQFNDDLASANNGVVLWGQGTTAGSTLANTTDSGLQIAYYNSSAFYVINIMDYSATDKHKTVLTREGNSGSGSAVEVLFSRWPSTSAITQVKVVAYNVSFNQGTTLALYGIAA